MKKNSADVNHSVKSMFLRAVAMALVLCLLPFSIARMSAPSRCSPVMTSSTSSRLQELILISGTA